MKHDTRKVGRSLERITVVPHQDSFENTALIESLRNAIENELFDMHYQPQINSHDNTCHHFEALIRWTDPMLGSISPAVFIPLSEKLDLMAEITRFVIRRVASDLRRWKQAGLPVNSVGINVSAAHFACEETAEQLIGWLLQESLPAESIIIELTETAMLQNAEMARRSMQRLHSLGFQIALDDFGTGYSSLAYLLDFPISIIKLDRTFTSLIARSVKCQTIVGALVKLAQELELEIVAEGVESTEQANLLHSWGCTLMQGYLFSRPIPASGILEYLMRDQLLLSLLDAATAC